MAIIVGILAGVSIVIARIINSNLGDEIGIWQSTFFNYAVGLIFSIVVLLISNERFNLLSFDFTLVPKYAYLGGIVSIGLISLSSFATPKTSALYLTLIIFIGQLFTGILLDYFTLHILSIGKIIGGILILLGLAINSTIDKRAMR